MTVKRPPSPPYRPLLQAFELLTKHLKDPASMKLQHFGVLAALVELTSKDRPISTGQLTEKFEESRSTVNKVLNNLVDLQLAVRVQTLASHGRGRSYSYYSSHDVLGNAIKAYEASTGRRLTGF